MEIAGFSVAKEEAAMRFRTHMTIQDYVRQRGLNNTADRFESSRHMDSKGGDHLFARILDEKQLSANAGQRGLTIRDYLAKPVAARSRMKLAFAVPETEGSNAPIAPSTPPAFHPPECAAALHQTSPKTDANRDRGSSMDVQSRIEVGIAAAAKRYDLPAELIRAVVRAESGFRVRAVSPAGAQGLMQLMPGTAKEMGVADPFDIDQNIDGGAKYLRAMLDRFDGDLKLALSAYNAGPGTVAKYKGHIPYAETRQYVDRVMRYARLST
jgi:soluble lytic murein transglycosylase-like protein